MLPDKRVRVSPAIFLAIACIGAIALIPATTVLAGHRSGPNKKTAPLAASPNRPSEPGSKTSRSAIRRKYASAPLSFEPNLGQADPSVDFVSHGSNFTFLLSPKEIVVSLQQQDPLLAKLDAKTQRKLQSRKLYRALAQTRGRHRRHNVRIQFDGVNAYARFEPLDELPGKTNYLLGNDRRKWLTGIPNYGRVRYSGIYPGVDLVYYGNQHQLEFDFVVSPGANPKTIALKFDSGEHPSLTEDGTLRLGSRHDAVLLRRPSVYQLEHGRKRAVRGGFVLLADGGVGVRVGSYDRNEPLIVDPILAYSTYLSGSAGAYCESIAVDSNDNIYVAGATPSTDFPVVNGYQSTGNANSVAFVSKFGPTGTTLLYSTYLGGTVGDYGMGIAIDPSSNVYVTGYTFSTDFPVVNGFQTSNNNPSYGNAFVARIDTTQTGAASLLYSSYLGGGGNSSNPLQVGDLGFDIAADASGLAYVTGMTTSDTSVAPFPTTAGAYQSSLASASGNAFLTVLNTNQSGGGSLVYSTYLGGDGAGSLIGDVGMGVAVDGSGDAYLVGQTTSDASGPFPTTASAFQSTLNSPNGNAFVAEIATTQSGAQSLVYSSYLGGSTTSVGGDSGNAIALDSAGKVYVTGDAESADFPVSSGAFQTTNSAGGKAFAAKFDLSQSGLQSFVYSTFLGGTNGSTGENGNGIAVDANGDAFLVGATSSSDFPTTSDAFQSGLKSSALNAFLSELNPGGTGLQYSTYMGGSSASGDVATTVALDPQGNVAYLAGYTNSSDFPTYPTNAVQTTVGGSPSGFVAKFAVQLQVGNFMPAGTLGTARYDQTATLLQNGKVLIAGGLGNNGKVLNTAELYDPQTGTFSATGSMNAARILHTATLLPNGEVLVTGGLYYDSFTFQEWSTAELYDPTTGTFSYTGNMSTPRTSHSATLLKNGQVLIVGGNANATDLSSAELYDPTSGAFTSTGSLLTPREQHTATLLADGRVLVVGGADYDDSNALASAEIYSPSNGTFAATGSLNTASENHTATLLDNGNVLVAGGGTPDVPCLARTEIYDPGAGTFTLSTSMSDARNYHTATALADGTVLVVGGQNATTDLASAEVFNPLNETFSAAGSLEIARAGHTSTLLNDGTVVVVGGIATTMDAALAELYAVTPPKPYSLQVTPTTVNMAVGNTQQFTAVNNLGYPRADATWSVSDPSLATITNDGSPVLTALGTGQVTLTAAVNGVFAEAQITIGASGTNPSPGSPFWSGSSLPGFSPLQVAQAMPSDSGPVLYSSQLSVDGTTTILQALTFDGQQLWQTQLPPLNADSIPDPWGGLLITENQTCNSNQTVPMSILDLDAGTGQPTWQITAQGITGAGPGGTTLYCYPIAPRIALRQDGSVIISASGNTSGLPELMVVNGETGQAVSEPYIPPSSYTQQNGTILDGYSPIAAPIVDSDGTTYVEYEVRQITYPPAVTSASLYLMELAPAPANTVTNILLSSTSANENLFPEQVFPDGNGDGGVLATWVVDPSSGPIPTNPYQAAYVISGAVDTAYSLPFTPQNFVLGSDGLPVNPSIVVGDEYAFVTDGTSSGDSTNLSLGPKVVSMNITSGAVNWTYQTGTQAVLSLIAATDDGGVTITDGSNVDQLDSQGNFTTLAPQAGSLGNSWAGYWYGFANGSASQISLPRLLWATSYAAMPGGNPARSAEYVGVTESVEGMPVFALLFWGPSCSLPANVGDRQKVSLTGNALTQYTNEKQALLNSGSLTCPSCSSFFNADPTRATYFSQLATAVTNQAPYDGPHTTISQYDAGMMNPALANFPRVVAIYKNSPVCSYFKYFKGVSPDGTTAVSQLAPIGGGTATDVYIDTSKTGLKYLTQGEILHEALHNLTGLNDFWDTASRNMYHIGAPYDLKSLLGLEVAPGVDPDPQGRTIDITNILQQNQCAANN